MAKEDFCFTYYDGDAARDKAHMNRLERGGYDDIITSQRKFGHLSLALIKKTLGSDFGSVWEALELVLKKDSEGKYFIEWLENSVQKMQRQSVKQSENGKKGGRPKTQTKPKQNPNTLKNESQEKPLGDGDENENVIGNKGKEGLGGKQILVFPAFSEKFFLYWQAWKDHLKEIKKPYQTFSSEQAELQFLGGHDEDTAIKMIEQSLKNGWKNIFELKNGRKESNNHFGKTPSSTLGDAATSILSRPQDFLPG